MADLQSFLDADGKPLPYVTSDAKSGFSIAPDAFSAVRLMMATIDGDLVEGGRLLTDFPSLPLLNGLLAIALALGEQAADGDQDKLRRMLDLLALNPIVDAADTAGEYRGRRVS